LIGLRIEDLFADSVPVAGTELLDEAGTKIGAIRSSGYSPTLDAWIALAYLDRGHRVPGTLLILHAADAPVKHFEAEVSLLPFYMPLSRETLAKQFYGEALKRFEADREDVDESAIALLKDAITLAPEFEDAYEALGVILHRHHRVDEAIHYMQLLAKMNPNCVMAHTNLSVFYVSKGMIQEAEAEKAIAGQLEQHQQLNAAQAERMAEAERGRIVAESEQRIGMFREVLEIDPEDPIANMGLGSAYIQLERYAEAIPFLEVASKVQKDYSAAWLNLGKCHEFLGNRDKAVMAYTEGIAAASRKGDLMPMKEMQRRLKVLEGVVRP
jgi:tetratricopeptide (TPR) repeat protein